MTAAVLVLLALAVAAPGATAAERPARDARSGDRAAIPAATAAARAALAKQLGDEGTVAADPVTGGLRAVGRSDALLTGRSAQDPATVALAYVRDHAVAFGLDAADLAQLQLGTRSTSPDGVTHLTWRQSLAGVPAYDSALFANVTADGRLVNAGGAPVHDLAVPATDPPLGPEAARAAARRDLGLAPDGAAATTAPGATRATTFAGTDDTASLVTLAAPGGDHLAWKLIAAGTNPYIYEVLVDAATGAVLTRHSLTAAASSATVVDHHPGAAAGGTPHTVDLAPWLPAAPTTLSGPNAHAYADAAAPDGIGGDAETPPSAGSDFLYPAIPVSAAGGQHCPTAFATPCSWDGASPATAAANQAATQLFHLVNTYHDWLAQPPIGFTSGAFNFETADPVKAEADDYGGFNNANMSTPPDGTSPRMQMYLFRAPFPAVNGSDDAGVVFHEYTHGLTGRLVGNDGQANGLQTHQSTAMGEGWSDWYAMDYLVAHGLVSDGAADGDVLVGDYVTDNANRGIRFNAVDCRVGSTDAAHCPGSASAGTGGFTFADMGRVGTTGPNLYYEPHNDGEIWAETLWDLRRAVGATTARGLITSALRLSPKQPSFLTMRDAILQADLVAGGTLRATIWSVFAARGMGYGARTSSGNGGVLAVSFAAPPLAAPGAPAVESPAPLGDGDGALEPGEVARVAIPLTNPAQTALTHVRATLATTTDGVVVGRATADYGTIAAGATGAATAPFAITVPTGVACGTIVGLTLTVASDQGTATPVALALPTGAGSATVASAVVPVAIPDNAPASGAAVSTLTIPDPGRVGHLRLALTVAHTYNGDLRAFLTSPSGTKVVLLDSPRSAGDGLDVLLDDDAPASLQDIPADGAVSGTWAPADAFAALAGEPRNGVWTLRLSDTTAGDAGSLTAWSLSTDQPACAATGPALPSAATGAAAAVDRTSATLGGTVTAAGAPTAGAFEYGTTAAYGTATGTLTPGGDGAVGAPLTGLTPATTYHFRALALRDGTVAAVGADRTFTTAPEPPAPSPSPPSAPPAQPLAPVTPAVPAPMPVISGLARTLRPDARGRVTLTFTVRPAPTPAAGTVTLKSASALRYGASRKKRVLTAGTARFTVPASGKVSVRLTLAKAARTYLRTHRTLKVRASVSVGKATRTAAITLQSRARL
jgi:subtilisin-like proprotein convertase family protein